MATEYRKFELVPEQQPPSGSTGVSLLTGGIVWIGEEGAFPVEISSSVMTQNEIDEYIWITEFPDRMVAAKAIFENSILWNVSYSQVDTYIDANVTNLSEAKAFLKKLSQVVLAILKFNGLVK